MLFSSFFTLLKKVRQLGLTQITLYGLYKIGLKTGHYKRIENRKVETGQILAKHLFSLPFREQLAKTLGGDGQQILISEADEIVAGKFRMFGGEPVELILAFDQPLHHWTDYETGKVSAIHDSPLQDIKFLWEPARFGWAYTLGRAYHLTQNETYAEAFWKYFEIFNDANPPNMGPHWMNGQEVAIRLIALVWANQVFGIPPVSSGKTAAASSAETLPQMGGERRARLVQSIWHHAARIPSTLLYARSQNNNHLVTEAAALYTAGLAFGHPKWRALGWRWLNWALRNQISGYGEYIQHSVNYHRVMLQTALWVDAIRDVDWPRLTYQSLGRATHWLFALLDPASGRTPNLGANDGALILPLSVTPFNDFRPTVQAAARAFLRAQMPGGTWDETSLWLGLGAHKESYESKQYLTDHLRGRNSWAYLRAGQFRSRLGHMDQLHLDLWWRGLNIAQDAGTYLYNTDPPWDNPLVSSRVHNTVTVDGHDQMTRGGRFMTLDWFPAFAKTLVPMDESVLGQLRGYHEGYRRVRHERTVTVYADERWLVEDKLISKEPHTYRLHWLLPDWGLVNREWNMDDGEFVLTLQSPFGSLQLTINHSPSLNASVSLARAGKIIVGEGDVFPYEGWISPTYGTKVPALSLAFEVQCDHTLHFRTEFIFPDES